LELLRLMARRIGNDKEFGRKYDNEKKRLLEKNREKNDHYTEFHCVDFGNRLEADLLDGILIRKID